MVNNSSAGLEVIDRLKRLSLLIIYAILLCSFKIDRSNNFVDGDSEHSSYNNERSYQFFLSLLDDSDSVVGEKQFAADSKEVDSNPSDESQITGGIIAGTTMVCILVIAIGFIIISVIIKRYKFNSSRGGTRTGQPHTNFSESRINSVSRAETYSSNYVYDEESSDEDENEVKMESDELDDKDSSSEINSSHQTSNSVQDTSLDVTSIDESANREVSS